MRVTCVRLVSGLRDAERLRRGTRSLSKHRHHGGNIQVVSAPDGRPLRTSGVRAGRVQDTTAAAPTPGSA